MAKKTFFVPFAYERYGRIKVETENEKDAFRIAEEKLKDMSLSEMEELSDYLMDSEEIDHDGILLDENGHVI